MGARQGQCLWQRGSVPGESVYVCVSSPQRLGQAALPCQGGGSNRCSQRAGQRWEDRAPAPGLQGGPSLGCREKGLYEC